MWHNTPHAEAQTVKSGLLNELLTMSYMSYIKSLPIAGSINTRDGAIALLKNYLANGCNAALFETSNCLSSVVFCSLKNQLYGLWSNWIEDGEEDDSGINDRGLGHRFIKQALLET